MLILLWSFLAIVSIVAFITGANILLYNEKCGKCKMKRRRYIPVVLSMTGVILTVIILLDDNMTIGFDHDLYEIYHAGFNMLIFSLFHINILKSIKNECPNKTKNKCN